MGLDRGLAVYYAMITSIDENVGRLLDKLDQLGLAENTIIFFLSDNGGGRRNHYNCGLRGHKGQVYEGGIRVPLLARWPGKWPAGKKIATIASHIDLLPTIAEACGARTPNGLKLDGVSLAPLLAGRVDDLRERMLFSHCHNRREIEPHRHQNCAVRTPRYKLVNHAELYDVLADPGEKLDIARKHPQLVVRLQEAYNDWWKRVSARRGFVPPAIPVGHPEENPSMLLAWHAVPHGGVGIRGGYAGEGQMFLAWLHNWREPGDFVHWNIDVVRGGRYQVIARYRCPKTDQGSRIRITAGDSSLDVEVLSIPANVHDAKWIERTLGAVELRPGKTRLTIKPLSIPGKSVMELTRLLLKRLN